jgi:hypothetical protein
MPTRQVKIAYNYSSLIRPIDIAYVDDAHKKFKKFCNDLRCPLCGSQLDGNIHRKEAKLYCVANNDEYKTIWHDHLIHPYSEQITYWYPQYQYVIMIQYVGGGIFDTNICRYNMDAHPSQRYKTMKQIFRYSGNRLLIFRQRMEEEQFLKKLKTIQVFS